MFVETKTFTPVCGIRNKRINYVGMRNKSFFMNVIDVAQKFIQSAPLVINNSVLISMNS